MQGSLVHGLRYLQNAMPDNDLAQCEVIRLLDTLVVARTIWAESRGEPADGQHAVANVITNRVRSGITWWGQGWLGVCLQPWQFSAFNEYTTADNPAALVKPFLGDLQSERRQIWLADGARWDDLADITNGATHYHTTAVTPTWMTELEETCRIGAHIFYR
jgi:N-acetylmuramoyl-L-alanine amidase